MSPKLPSHVSSPRPTVYRNSFRLTYAEMGAPNGEWKSVAAGYFVILSIAFWFMVIIKKIGEFFAVFIITSPIIIITSHITIITSPITIITSPITIITSPITIITSPITIITSVFIIDYFSWILMRTNTLLA